MKKKQVAIQNGAPGFSDEISIVKIAEILLLGSMISEVMVALKVMFD